MKLEENKIIERGEGIVLVTVDGDDWGAAKKKAKNKIAAKVKIPGFRPGKAPINKINDAISNSEILIEAARIKIKDCWDFALKNKTIEQYSESSVAIKKVDDSFAIIEFSFDLKPELKIDEYKGIKLKDIKKQSITVGEDEISKGIDQYRNRLAMEQEKDANDKIENGDVVIFDFEGFVDGVAFKGGKALNHTLVIGDKKMIPGFEESMIGLKLGESVIKVKFPKDYTEELSNKDAEFKLKINTIKKRILPELNDEFVKDLNLKNIENIEQLKKHVKDMAIEQAESNEKGVFVSAIIKEIAKKSNIVIPKSAILKENEKLYKEFEQTLLAKKMTIKEYVDKTGLSIDQIKAETFDDARERIKSYLVTDAVRNNEKFEINEEDLLKKYQSICQMFNSDIDQIRNVILTDEQVSEEINRSKIIDFLYENNG